MQPVQPNSSVLSPTTALSNNEVYCARIALTIIASLASFLCLPFKLAIGLNVVVLAAAAYYTCSPNIADMIKPPPPQPQNTPVPEPQPHISPVTPVLPAQQSREVGPTMIEVPELKLMICTFDTVEARNVFLNESCLKRLDPFAHIVPTRLEVTFMAKHGYTVADILSNLFSHHPKEGRPTEITIKANDVICKFDTPNSVINFMSRATRINLFPQMLTIFYNPPSVLIKGCFGYMPLGIIGALALFLVDSFKSDVYPS